MSESHRPMNAEERERQRLQRLRESQIRSRDPGPSKIRHYDWSHQRQRPRRSLRRELVDAVPTRMRGLAFGLLFGIVVALLVGVAAPGLHVLGVAAIPVSMVVGWILGMVVQSQE